MASVGGAIQGHPDGTIAGGRAMRQALDAHMTGLSLAEKAKDCPELNRALEAWPSQGQ